MNPCPCGFWNDPTRECRCSLTQIQRYVGQISGPLLDRIDIHIDVPAVKFRELRGETAPETDSSAVIRQRVITARERQHRRFANEKIFSNAAMTPRMIRAYCQIDSNSEKMLESAMRRLGLIGARLRSDSQSQPDDRGSGRRGRDQFESRFRSVGYRSLDRTYWT